MANINVKKQIVAQANNPVAPKVTPTINPTPTSTNTGVKPAVVNNSSISSPKINQFTNPVGANTTPGAPGALTGAKANVAKTATPTTTSAITPPGSPIDIAKPIIDDGRKENEDFLNQWQQQQTDRLQKEYEQQLKLLNDSKGGVEDWFNDGKGELGETLYGQQERLNIDGTNRGISNSPQILGLQGVHNINYNKNLTNLMKQKATLLKDIDNKISSLGTAHSGDMTDLSLEILRQKNNYSNDYNQKMYDLMMQKYQQDYQKYLTDDEREYDRSTTQEDRDWQKEWLKYQMEMEKAYSNNKPFSYTSNYKPNYSYTGGGGYTPYNYTPYAKTATASYDGSDAVNGAGIEQFKYASSDTFNDIKNNNRIDLDNILDANADYERVMQEYAKELGVTPQEYQNEGQNVTGIAKNKMYDWAKAVSTNTPYVDNKGVARTPMTPYNEKTIRSNKEKAEIIKHMMRGNNTVANNLGDITDKIKIKPSYKPKTVSVGSSRTSSKRGQGMLKTAKTVEKMTNNTKKAVSNSKKNVKKSTSNSKKNTVKSSSKSNENYNKSVKKSVNNVKKSVSNSKKNTKKSKSNSLKNIKKNIAKLFHWK